MKRLPIYFLLGFSLLIIQSALLHPLLPDPLKPNLLLLVIIYLALVEPPTSGGVIAFLLGCCFDVFAGIFLGLHGLVYLVLFLLLRWASRSFNTESLALLLLLPLMSTLVEGVLVVATLGIFAETGPMSLIVLRQVVPQAAANTLVAWCLLFLLGWLQGRLGPRWRVPGLSRLTNRHGF